jgi:hypothetical protein
MVVSMKHNPTLLSILLLVIMTLIILTALPSTPGQHTYPQENNRYRNPYRVFGYGDISGISPINITWHGRLREGSEQYSHTVAGFYYKTNLLITNQEGMQYGQYRLAIRDKTTHVLINQSNLPCNLLIKNFTGTLSIMYYYYPHGPDGCGFFMVGTAEAFGNFSP